MAEPDVNCALTKGRKEPCKDSVGGLRAVYFANFGIEPTFDTGTDEITDLQVDAAAVTFYKYEVKGAGNNFEEAVQSSRDNGTTFWQQTLNMALKKLTAADRKQFKLLAYGRPHVVVHDQNGNAFVLGLYNGMDVTGGTTVTGAAMGDMSGYTLVMSGMEKYPAHMIMGSTFDDPFAGLTTTPTIVEGADDEPG